ncbi:hypothetical protein Pint_31554 [Pistacia integerrima]|uniref:Uncharacterized protein n=1 Tax=Pistacia integerrima TaxID=434235 RepID=A0ACC0XPZ6_9ROSI|nr:hypothetical protein Pint_31554 [Pistacia integerrima]
MQKVIFKKSLELMGRFKYQPGQIRAFGMLAGGTGITPMFQVCILKSATDQ